MTSSDTVTQCEVCAHGKAIVGWGHHPDYSTVWMCRECFLDALDLSDNPPTGTIVISGVTMRIVPLARKEVNTPQQDRRSAGSRPETQPTERTAGDPAVWLRSGIAGVTP